MKIKSAKLLELNISIATVFLNIQTLKIENRKFESLKIENLVENKCLCCNKNYQHKFDKTVICHF